MFRLLIVPSQAPHDRTTPRNPSKPSSLESRQESKRFKRIATVACVHILHMAIPNRWNYVNFIDGRERAFEVIGVRVAFFFYVYFADTCWEEDIARSCGAPRAT